MINIHNINEIAQALGGQSQTRQKSGEAADAFDAVLNSALNKTDSAENATAADGLEEIAAPGFNLEPVSSIVTGKTDKLIGMLESYAGQLENPGVSLRQMEPVLEEINAKADALLEKTKLLGEADSGLKDIATQTAVTARTEYMKFQRGDYLS
ncbi:MAG: hypothetical protein HUN04_07655 [Desulfobacter sp.]|nr:MAG: hypothetical protein HUN04_07655 [Desulfobacter sp.]